MALDEQTRSGGLPSPRFSRRGALRAFAASSAGIAMATVPPVWAGRPEPVAEAMARLKVHELIVDPDRDPGDFTGYAIDAHRACEAARYFEDRLKAVLPESGRMLLREFDEARDRARDAVEEETMLRVVDALAKHFPQLAPAIRVVGQHVMDAECGIGDDCEHLLPPWRPYRWDACAGLIEEGRPVA